MHYEFIEVIKAQGCFINDVAQFSTIFDPPPPWSRIRLLIPQYCCHEILEPLPLKTVTSFMDDPLIISYSRILTLQVVRPSSDNRHRSRSSRRVPESISSISPSSSSSSDSEVNSDFSQDRNKHLVNNRFLIWHFFHFYCSM